jgi:dTMP kinase
MRDSVSSLNHRFVCLIGMDGSGKSTLAHSVIGALSRREMEFQYVHGLMQGKFSNPLMATGRLLFARGKSRESNYEGFVSAKRRSVSRQPTLFSLYRAIVFLDYIPQVVWKIVFPLARGSSIILDRYVYDTVINLELNSSYNPERVERTLDLFFHIFPRPSLTFLIDVPEEIAFSRKPDVPDIKHLQERRELYQRMAKHLDITVLDGTLSVESLTNRVVEAISNGTKDI